MKRKYILAGCLALYLKAKSQEIDTNFKHRNIPKSEIEAVFSHYNQEGNHSAVTGGKGTEELQVYTSYLSLKQRINSNNELIIKGGADVISSASTDKIDDVVSSASRKDTRSFVNIHYSRNLKNSHFSVGAGAGVSIESDYLSQPVNLSINYNNPVALRNIYLDLQAYFDDLRWGRLNPDYYSPVKLIYPEELRDSNWFDENKRFTFSVKTGITQVINKRLVVGFFPGLIYQKGLLSTPFHRVYFKNDELRVENLPNKRWKIPLGLKANYFAQSRLVFRLTYNFYWDSFGILANSTEIETTYKVSPLFIINPFIRLYTQTSSIFFNKFGMNDSESEFYTSDYDLSKFQTLKTGLGMKYHPTSFLNQKLMFNEIELRYAYYIRTDNLNAHILTLNFKFDAY